jgi:hypothetical protein
MKLFISIAILFLFAGCSKNINKITPTCEFYTLLSDKYTGDSSYIRTDTLSPKYAYACGKDLDSCKKYAIQWLNNCGNNTIECLRYVFGNKKTDPIIFK